MTLMAIAPISMSRMLISRAETLTNAFISLAGSLGLFLLLIGNAVTANADTPWDAVRASTCGDLVSSDGSSTPKLAAFTFTWLAGYRDGLAALAAMDPRLKAVGNAKLEQFGPLVLAYCRAKPNLPVTEAATGVFELFINAQPGVRIGLSLPHTSP